jgi:hypothetical protein
VQQTSWNNSEDLTQNQWAKCAGMASTSSFMSESNRKMNIQQAVGYLEDTISADEERLLQDTTRTASCLRRRLVVRDDSDGDDRDDTWPSLKSHGVNENVFTP